MKVKPTNTCKHLRVSYIINIVPLTCTCFDHSCGHSQGGVISKDILQKLQEPVQKCKILAH